MMMVNLKLYHSTPILKAFPGIWTEANAAYTAGVGLPTIFPHTPKDGGACCPSSNRSVERDGLSHSQTTSNQLRNNRDASFQAVAFEGCGFCLLQAKLLGDICVSLLFWLAEASFLTQFIWHIHQCPETRSGVAFKESSLCGFPPDKRRHH